MTVSSHCSPSSVMLISSKRRWWRGMWGERKNEGGREWQGSEEWREEEEETKEEEREGRKVGRRVFSR